MSMYHLQQRQKEKKFAEAVIALHEQDLELSQQSHIQASNVLHQSMAATATKDIEPCPSILPQNESKPQSKRRRGLQSSNSSYPALPPRPENASASPSSSSFSLHAASSRSKKGDNLIIGNATFDSSSDSDSGGDSLSSDQEAEIQNTKLAKYSTFAALPSSSMSSALSLIRSNAENATSQLPQPEPSTFGGTPIVENHKEPVLVELMPSLSKSQKKRKKRQKKFETKKHWQEAANAQPLAAKGKCGSENEDEIDDEDAKLRAIERNNQRILHLERQKELERDRLEKQAAHRRLQELEEKSFAEAKQNNVRKLLSDSDLTKAILGDRFTCGSDASVVSQLFGRRAQTVQEPLFPQIQP